MRLRTFAALARNRLFRLRCATLSQTIGLILLSFDVFWTSSRTSRTNCLFLETYPARPALLLWLPLRCLLGTSWVPPGRLLGVSEEILVRFIHRSRSRCRCRCRYRHRCSDPDPGPDLNAHTDSDIDPIQMQTHIQIPVQRQTRVRVRSKSRSRRRFRSRCRFRFRLQLQPQIQIEIHI